MPAPTLVQHIGHPNTTGNLVTVCNFPMPTYPGNIGVPSGCYVGIWVNNASSYTPTSVSDDQGNSYTLHGTPISDGSQKLSYYYKANITNGPKKIIVTYPGGGANYVACQIHTLGGTATTSPIDGYATSSGSGTAMTSGNATTATTDTMILSAFVQSSTDQPTGIWTAGSGFNWMNCDNLDSLAVQYQTKAATGAINPAATMTDSHNWIGATVGIKNGAGGTWSGTGIRIQGYQHNAFGTVTTSPRTINAPCRGNRLVATWCGVTVPVITAITDTNGNTWVQHPNSPIQHSQVIGQMWWVNDAITSANMRITVTYTGSVTSGSMFQVWDISGSAVVKDTAWDTGSEPSLAAWAGCSITPTIINGLMISTMTVDSNTTLSVSPSQMMTPTFPVEQTSPWHAGQNDGTGCYYNSNLSQITNNWTSDVFPEGWLELMALFSGQPPVTVDALSPLALPRGSNAQPLTLTGTRFDGA